MTILKIVYLTGAGWGWPSPVPDVGDVPLGRPVHGDPRDLRVDAGGVGVADDLAERRAEAAVTGRGQLLGGQEQHQVLEQQLLEPRHPGVVERLEVETAHLRAQGAADRS